MRKTNQQTIGQILDQFIKENNLKEGLTQVELTQRWSEITGEFISKHTVEIKLVKKVLYVTMDNAACKQELAFKKSEVLQRVNLLTPKNQIIDIYIK
ncbi:MAG: DciA family protein [Bacteroidota bacterium]|jgi:predicted nucleic acid-binding Zn ribbon protein